MKSSFAKVDNSIFGKIEFLVALETIDKMLHIPEIPVFLSLLHILKLHYLIPVLLQKWIIWSIDFLQNWTNIQAVMRRGKSILSALNRIVWCSTSTVCYTLTLLFMTIAVVL